MGVTPHHTTMYTDLESFIRGRIEELRTMYIGSKTEGDRLAQYTVCARFFELHGVAQRIGMEVEHPDTFFSSGG